MILGTGVGGGLVVNGRVVTGANAIARGVGPQPAAVARATTSGRARRATAAAPAASRRSSPGRAWRATTRPAQRPDGSIRAGIVAGAADAGDADARRGLIARYERRLARGLASIINVLDPDVIVLGGGLSNIARLYERVPRLWTEFVFSDAVVTRLVRAVHGDSSGVRGAAWLWE